jgi:hypothetical protein
MRVVQRVYLFAFCNSKQDQRFVRIYRQIMSAASSAAAAALREEFTDIGVCVCGPDENTKGYLPFELHTFGETRKIKDMDVLLRSVRHLLSGCNRSAGVSHVHPQGTRSLQG